MPGLALRSRMSLEEAREDSLQMQLGWEGLGPDPRGDRQVYIRSREKWGGGGGLLFTSK